MIRNKLYNKPTLTSWPRTSGDDPFVVYGKCANNELAPHERG